MISEDTFATIDPQIHTLSIGASAPDFKLKGIDGKKYSLKKFKKADILMIVFTCNHCPTAQAYEDRLIAISNDYKKKGVQVVAISSNDPTAVRLDELGYSDLNDSYEEMKIRNEEKKFPFPYLYDGDKQLAAKAYGPVATPHVFIFNKQRKLQYQGRIDDVEKPSKKPNVSDARNALDDIIAGKPVGVTTTKVFGCSIKWANKNNWITEYKKKWAEEEVTINSIDVEGIKTLLQNNTDKLRLINIWATWCGPCITEFPDLVEINRMYRGRDFEMVTISADDPSIQAKVLKSLKAHQASTTNFHFNSDDKYSLINAVDAQWQGALPYTIIVEPGGKVIYRVQGKIDVQIVKKKIVDSSIIGRYFK
jgi:peroxiredoxin